MWPNTVFERFCWCDSARAQELQKKTCQLSDHFIYSKPALSVVFFSIIERSVLMALVCYCKDMLRKVTTQRTQQFLAFLCYRKNPVKCSACAVARKIETDCFAETCRFLAIQSLEFQEIWQNNSSETTWMIYRKKSEFWHREFLTCSDNDLRKITKIAYVKILLKRCWQKGFNVSS